MVEIILWSIAFGIACACGGFAVGWLAGRRRIRRAIPKRSTVDSFLNLLRH